MNVSETKQFIWNKIFKMHYDETFKKDSEITKLVNPNNFIFKNTMDFQNNDKIIWNYTSWDGFKAICKSNEYQIGHFRHMNDPMEFIHTEKLCLDALSNTDATIDELIEFNNAWNILPFQDAYIWSFSLNHKNLALFSNYSGQNSDKGIAMGYDGQITMESLNDHFNKGITSTDQIDFGNAYIFCLKVSYDMELQNHITSLISKEWLIDHRAAKMKVEAAKKIELLMTQLMFFCGLIFKNPDLHYEEEIRYVVLNKNDDTLIHPEGIRNDKPYVTCPICTSGMLTNAIIQANSPHSIDEVNTILNNSNLNDVDISLSELPY